MELQRSPETSRDGPPWGDPGVHCGPDECLTGHCGPRQLWINTDSSTLGCGSSGWLLNSARLRTVRPQNRAKLASFKTVSPTWALPIGTDDHTQTERLKQPQGQPRFQVGGIVLHPDWKRDKVNGQEPLQWGTAPWASSEKCNLPPCSWQTRPDKPCVWTLWRKLRSQQLPRRGQARPTLPARPETAVVRWKGPDLGSESSREL